MVTTNAITVKKSFPVTGMSCASCAISAESIVISEPGVISASVNFASSSLLVEYDPGITSPAKLKQAVQGIGYDLLIDDSKEAGEALEDQHREKLSSLKKKTTWALTFSLIMGALGMFFMHLPYVEYIMWALATPVIMVFGRQFFINA